MKLPRFLGRGCSLETLSGPVETFLMIRGGFGKEEERESWRKSGKIVKEAVEAAVSMNMCETV